MKHIVPAVGAYAAAMILANLILSWAIGTWGPSVIPLASGLIAFVLIGFDLTMRDWLHVRLSKTQMLLLIAATGLLTYALNPAAGMIAVASASAFSAAALADWATFTVVRGPWAVRANASNVVGAAVDSIVFPLMIGALLPSVVAAQFVAKVAGGAIWSAVLGVRLAR